jgi:hypothetical protein
MVNKQFLKTMSYNALLFLTLAEGQASEELEADEDDWQQAFQQPCEEDYAFFHQESEGHSLISENT